MSAQKSFQTDTVTRDRHDLEMRAFSIVIGKLLEASEKGGRHRVEASYMCHELWTSLMTNLALPVNDLQDEIKAGLISLGLWVQRYSHETMQGTAPLDPLIAVNKRVLEGLTAIPGGKQTPAVA
jgi:flagellar biosynthesis activator protein FlaF